MPLALLTPVRAGASRAPGGPATGLAQTGSAIEPRPERSVHWADLSGQIPPTTVSSPLPGEPFPGASTAGLEEALFRADPFSSLSLEGLLPPENLPALLESAPPPEAEADASQGTRAIVSRQTFPLDTLPTEEERARLSLQFWQAPVPPSTAETGVFSEYAALARHPRMGKAGPFGFSASFHAASIFDDNITLAGKGRRADMQLSAGPRARLQLGSGDTPLNLGLGYAGAASWFTRTPDQRAYEQTLAADGGWNGPRLKTGFRLGFQGTHSGSVDAGERVGRRVVYAGLTGSYPWGSKFSGECSADFTRARFNGLLGSREYRAQQYVNYQWTPKTQFGLGLTEGLLRPDRGQEQTYEQLLARMVSQPTAKVGFNASFGAENRQFDSGQESTFTPVYTLAANWQATGRTSFSLEGRRRTFASAALEKQNYEASNLTLTAREMLSATLDAAVSLGYERADYTSASPGSVASRRDDYCFSRASLDWALHKNCALGMFYEFSRNFSEGADGHPFRRNRVGLSVNLSF